MRREDVVNLFDRLPETEHARVHLIMRAGPNVSVDMVARFEPSYAVVRGREAGNQDEGRVFFVPYDDITYLKLERAVKGSELEEWFSDTAKIERTDTEAKAVPAAPAPEPEMEMLDPSEIARKNLLARLRAARSVIKQ